MRKLIAISMLCTLVGCSQQDANSGADKFVHCNNTSSGLAEYGKCRCQQITGAKSMTKEMDDCMTNPKVYAEGFKGEIPERIRNLME